LDSDNIALRGKVAWVTGGGRGIGASVAQRLASFGATVVISGRSVAPLQTVNQQIVASGGSCRTQVCDVTVWGQVEATVKRVQQEFGRLDILVNNAGVAAPGGPLHQLSFEDWEAVMNTNLRGVFYAIKASTGLMVASGGGHIINISSIASKNALPGAAAYSASKWGLNGLSVAVAEELRGQNIRVSIICPGSTDTELIRAFGGRDTRKMLRPADVAHVVAMLVTQDTNSFASEIVLRPTQKP
jgi:NAD(P)-dependent dehydrogenase (short-subunit alcohol dehydrogenase family)